MNDGLKIKLFVGVLAAMSLSGCAGGAGDGDLPAPLQASCEAERLDHPVAARIKPVSVTVLDRNERRDEPYVVSIAFKSTFNSVFSTQVTDIPEDLAKPRVRLRDGESAALPAAGWPELLDGLDPLSLADLADDCPRMTIFGALMIAFEDDATTDRRMRQLLEGVVPALNEALTVNIANVGFDELADGGETRLSAAADSVTAATRLTGGQKFGTWIRSLLNADDMIGYHLAVGIPVENRIANGLKINGQAGGGNLVFRVPLSTDEATIFGMHCRRDGTCDLMTRRRDANGLVVHDTAQGFSFEVDETQKRVLGVAVGNRLARYRIEAEVSRF